jgi:hypothetical protein
MPKRTHRPGPAVPTRATGAVLLEIVLAMAVFMLAAGILYGAMNNALRRIRAIELQNRAADLAVSKLSEVRMGLLDPARQGPERYDAERFPELEGWQWQLLAEDIAPDPELPTQTQLTVVISHPERNVSYSLVEQLPGAAEQDEAEPDGGTP